MITANVKQFWDATASRPNWREYILPKRTDSEFDNEGKQQADVIRALLPVNGGTVIEYGCGIGRISKYMTQHAGRMIGLDICEAFLQKARQRDSSEYHLVNEFRESDIADLVYSVSVMQHNTVENVATAMADIHRLLRPCGACFVTFAYGPVYTQSAFVRKFTEREVMEVAAGFSDVQIIKTNLVRYSGYTIPKGETNELVLIAKKEAVV